MAITAALFVVLSLWCSSLSTDGYNTLMLQTQIPSWKYDYFFTTKVIWFCHSTLKLRSNNPGSEPSNNAFYYCLVSYWYVTKQGKKVCKTTAFRCYRCFSLRFLRAELIGCNKKERRSYSSF